ncbi:MAG: hypothetical protein ACRCSY_02575 [Cetobacterium sp.]
MKCNEGFRYFGTTFRLDIKTEFEEFSYYGVKKERFSFVAQFDNELGLMHTGRMDINLGLDYLKEYLIKKMKSEYVEKREKGVNIIYQTLEESVKIVDFIFIVIEALEER